MDPSSSDLSRLRDLLRLDGGRKTNRLLLRLDGDGRRELDCLLLRLYDCGGNWDELCNLCRARLPNRGRGRPADLLRSSLPAIAASIRWHGGGGRARGIYRVATEAS